MDSKRPNDIVVYGASGFTGRLVAEYLLEHHDGELTFALGGRNRDKLAAVASELGRPDLPIVVADSLDRASLDAMVRDARVVCTTVGPYSKYGDELVAACVEHGTDYCDLSGEPHFIRRVIDRHHAAAVEGKTRIVHCCGYDSIPSDLGAQMMQEAMKQRHGVYASEIHHYFGETKGRPSGGTVASMLTILDDARDRAVRRVLRDPYGLNPEGERRGPDGPDPRRVRFDHELGMWTGPFPMASINSRIVRRSHALAGYPYGRDFRYVECSSFGRGARGLARATATMSALAALYASVRSTRTRGLAKRWLPSPGEGPNRAERDAGYFVSRLIAKGRNQEGRKVSLRGRIKGQADPGYGETAKMLGESAVCLALDEPTGSLAGGVLTPATAMGATLRERLRAAGMVFEVS